MIAVAAFLPVLVIACASPEADNSTAASADLVGGVVTNVDGVGALVVEENGARVELCTATLIAQDLALTAAHCIDHPNATIMFTIDGVERPADGWEWAFDFKPFWQPYVGAPARNDIGLVHLLPATRPLATRSIAAQAPRPGGAVTLAGAGSAGDGSFGTLRTGDASVSYVGFNAGWFSTASPGVFVGPGDSGGPVFDNAGDIVGVTSVGDGAGISVFTLVPSYAGWISSTRARRDW